METQHEWINMKHMERAYCNPINIREPLISRKYFFYFFLFFFGNFCRQKYIFLGFLVFPSAPIYVLTLKLDDL